MPKTVRYKTRITSLDYINYVVIPVPAEILAQLSEDGEMNFQQRVIIRVDDRAEWQGGTMAMGEGDACITINSARMKAIHKREGDEVEVELQPDDSKYGVPVPPSLAEYWETEREAFRRFEALKPSMQRYVLNHISGVKSLEKQIQRTIATMEALLQSREGEETYRDIVKK